MKKLLNNNILKFCVKHGFQRKPFAKLDIKDIEFFKSVLPKQRILTDFNDVEPYNTSFTKTEKGRSQLVLSPKTTEEVAKILRHCNERRLAVVPQGGNTGLVGGSVPVFDQIVLSLRGMDRIEGFDPVSGVVAVEAGVILEKLNAFLAPHGCEAPLDLGAKGSCMLGGNAATHAGGKYVLRNGPLRAHVRGLQAVLPSGQILDLRSSLAKDNTGYDLKQLFLGSEGTLGIITRLDLHCPKSDPFRKILVFKSKSYEMLLEAIPKVKSILGKHLNALEYMDGSSYKAVSEKLHQSIFDSVALQDHLLFIESSTDETDGLIEQLEDFQDAIMSNSDKEFQRIWKVREDVGIAAPMYGEFLSYDVSFDVKEWNEMIQKIRRETGANVLGFGHIGDGNLHLVIILKQGQQFDDSYLFEQVAKKRGSISAEHGVGLHKTKYLHLMKSAATLHLYKEIKNIFDPKGIMNPYKMLPE